MLRSIFKAMEKFSPHAYDGKQKIGMEKMTDFKNSKILRQGCSH